MRAAGVAPYPGLIESCQAFMRAAWLTGVICPQGNTLAEPLPVAWAVSHWAEDPWARGSWSGLLVGGTAADRARLAEPVGDRLVLAGEAIHPVAPAMAHGAY